jgi:phage-related protein
MCRWWAPPDETRAPEPRGPLSPGLGWSPSHFRDIVQHVPWRVEILDRRVERELDELAADVRQRFLRIAELIERHGPAGVHEPYVKHLDGKLWEMRMKGRDGIARAIYVTAQGERVIVLHAFVKKTQKTPQRALEIARERAKEVR